jgi:hypothetical protein
MSEEITAVPPPESPDSEGSVLSTVASGAIDYLTGVPIPAPVKRSFFKAFGQLCTALVDVPVAYLEAKADGIRAVSAEDKKLLTITGDKIAEHVEVPPEFGKIAAEKNAQKILRERINLNKVCGVAAEQIKQEYLPLSTDTEQQTNVEPDTEPVKSSEENIINDDWLNTFENEAASKSSEEMQQLFGRILAGEILKPKSFSIKTLRLISQLDGEIAKSFRILCSLAVSIQSPPGNIHDARVISIGGNAAQNALVEYGLGFRTLNTLEEYGLIIADYNSYINYDDCIARSDNKVNAVMGFQNKLWGLTRINDNKASLRLHGVALSNSGQELLKIVDLEPSPKYMLDLLKHLQSLGYLLVEIKQ